MVLISVIATLAVVVYLILFAPWRPHGGESIEKIRADFCGALPVGATENRVTAFLLERKAEHSQLIRQDRAIYAYLGNTGRTVFFDCSTKVKFTFGDDDRLLTCDVSQACDGP
jgi:hypothetical protein